MTTDLDHRIRRLVADTIEASPEAPTFDSLTIAPTIPRTAAGGGRRPGTARAVMAAALLVSVVALAVVVATHSDGSRSNAPGQGVLVPAHLEVHALATLTFDATEYRVPAGEVEITLVSDGGLHTLAFDEPRLAGFRLTATQGHPESATIDLAPGTYTIYCTLPGHREAGTEARLVVTAR
jgi:uncharacterized cupredoxin-like copper-binding protein